MTSRPPADSLSMKDISSAATSLGLSSNLLDEVYGPNAKLPSTLERPKDPHYVGQDQYDTLNGILDLSQHDKTGATTEFNSSLSDLGKESKLISTAQKNGLTAENEVEDLIHGKSKSNSAALSELDKIIGGLDKNYYNYSDRADFQAAETALKNGDNQKALADIANAESILGHKSTDVANATTDMTTARNDAQKGDFTGAAAAAFKSATDLHTHHHKHARPIPVGPEQP